MNTKSIHRFFLLLIAPFLGMLTWIFLSFSQMTLTVAEFQRPLPVDVQLDPQPVVQAIEVANEYIAETSETINHLHEMSSLSTTLIHEIGSLASAQTHRPYLIYDRRITAKLGTAVQHISSDAIDLKLFYFDEKHYKGYIMKVQLKQDSAMQMVLGKDQIGESETTLEAVKRKQAIAGINAGGFADDPKTNKRYPLSTTMLEGTYVYGFDPSSENLTFIGLDHNRKLIGGEFSIQSELDQLNPQFGVTFVPVLLKSGEKQLIPEKWQTSPLRAPRTIIGNYKDDQLLFIVTDGYNKNGSAGATLKEIQDKLIEWGIQDAYNLDGGGSSTLILNDEVINQPSDERLRPLATHFLFFK